MRWEFIDTFLQVADISKLLCNIIMLAISSSIMQILWNTVPTQKFRATSSVRQGCSLFPYLCILCMEWVGHSIRSTIDFGRWSPIFLSRTGPLLSHIFSVDDLILFGQVEEHRTRVIKEFWISSVSFQVTKLIYETNIFLESHGR